MNKKNFLHICIGICIGVSLMAACGAAASQPVGEEVPGATLIATIAESRMQLYRVVDNNYGVGICYIVFPSGHIFCR